jgi:hypothetical protein
MVGWVNSDVAISRMGNEKVLQMTTSHLWQLAETHALFGWSDVLVPDVNLTLEGPKPQFYAYTSLEKLDDAIRKSAEGGWLKMLGIKAESWDGLKQRVVENWDVVVDAAVRRLGEEVRGELNALRDLLNDDKIAREVVGPALLLIQAEKLGVNEETLRYFGAVVSGAIDGDGSVYAASRMVSLASGKYAVALLWVAALAAYGINAEVKRGNTAFLVVVFGGDAAKLAALYFLFAPPLLEGDERIINHKLAEAMKLAAEGLNVSWEGLRRRTEDSAAADLIISVDDIKIKYNVYLRGHDILLQFYSTDRSRVELAARLLRLAGVSAEVTKVGGRDAWRIEASTDKLAAGREELRDALAEIVRKAVEKGWVDAGKAEGWLEKLEKGLTLMEGWPKYLVRLAKGALDVRFTSTNPASIEREAQRLEKMGLERGVHFSVKMPKGGKAGYVSVLKEGLAYAAWLSVRGEDEQQRRSAADFVKHVLRRAEKACGGRKEECAVYEKAKEIVEWGKKWGSLELAGIREVEVEVDGEKYVVTVTGGGAKIEGELLRLWITAVVKVKDGGAKTEGKLATTACVGGEANCNYTITYSRRGKRNKAVGRAAARADAPGGREADEKRFAAAINAAVIKALTGEEPRIIEKSDGRIEVECGRAHLDGFMLYKEFFGDIMQWLKKTSRRGRGADGRNAA